MSKHIDLGNHARIPNKKGVKEIYRIKEQSENFLVSLRHNEERLRDLGVELAFPSLDGTFYEYIRKSDEWDFIPLFEWEPHNPNIRVVISYMCRVNPEYIVGLHSYRIPIYPFYIGFVTADNADINEDYSFILRPHIGATELVTGSLNLLYPKGCDTTQILSGDIRSIREVDELHLYEDMLEDSGNFQRAFMDVVRYARDLESTLSRYHTTAVLREKDSEIEEIFTYGGDKVEEEDLKHVVRVLREEAPQHCEYYIRKIYQRLVDRFRFGIINPEFIFDSEYLGADLLAMDTILDLLLDQTTDERAKEILTRLRCPYSRMSQDALHGKSIDQIIKHREHIGGLNFLFNGEWVESTIWLRSEANDYWTKYRFNRYYMFKLHEIMGHEKSVINQINKSREQS